MPVKEESKLKESYPRGRLRREERTEFREHQSRKTQIPVSKVLFNMWKSIPIKLSKMWVKNMPAKVFKDSHLNQMP